MAHSNSSVPERNSAVELLRILAIGMIVLSHICYHSGFDTLYAPVSINRLFLQFGFLGNLGVDLFLLISGYFLWNKPFRRRSLSALLAQVWFYSLALFAVCKWGFGFDYSREQLWQVFLPTIFNEYWFFTAYFVLTLLSPFVNAMLASLTRMQHRNLLGIMIFLWSVIPTLARQPMYGGELAQLLLCYCAGAYLQRFPDNRFRNGALRWGVTIGAFCTLYGLTVVLAYCERFAPEFFGASFPLYYRCSLPTLGCALGLFSLAVFWKPFSRKWINQLSACTFGVYLIHDNPAVRVILWQQLLDHTDYATSPSLIPRLLGSVLLVYMVCAAIEYLRLKTVAKPTARLVDSLLCKIFPA